MAIVRLGPIVGAISGSVGAVVFVAGGRSTVIRPRPITRHKSSRFLALSKSRMHGLRKRWRILPDLDRDAWDTHAALLNSTNTLGQSSPTTGYLLYIRVNLERRLGFSNAVGTPGALEITGPPVNIATAFSASGTFTITADPPIGTPAASFFMYGWPFWTNTKPGSIPRLVFLQSAPGNPLNFDVRSLWESHFGTMVEGQHFAIGLAALVLAIRRSQIISIPGTVTA